MTGSAFSRIRVGGAARLLALATSVAPLALIAAEPAFAQALGQNGGTGGSAPNYFTPGGGGAANVSGNGVVTGGSGGGGTTGGSGNLGGGGGGADSGGGGGRGLSLGAGGGGGGSGGAGLSVTVSGTTTVSSGATGGNGGNGGSGVGNFINSSQFDGGGGGGGGGGGSGLYIGGTNTGIAVVISAGTTVNGGTGGRGGSGNSEQAGVNPTDAGAGGNGGHGVRVESSTGAIISNSGTIIGGTGGEGGFYEGFQRPGIGAAGVGVIGHDIILTNTSTGVIKGGDSFTNAITITGGTNSIANAGSIQGKIELTGGTTTVSGTYSDVLQVNGGVTLTVTGATAAGDATGITYLNNSGTVTIGDGRTLSAVTINNSGTIGIGAGATLQGTGNTLNNNATINVGAGGSVVDAGDINNNGGGVINFNGPTGTATLSSGTDTIYNDGQIKVLGGDVDVDGGDINNRNSGSVSLTGGNMFGVGTFTNSGTATLNVGAGTTLGVETFAFTGGSLTGTGTIEASDAVLFYNSASGGTASFDIETGAKFDISGLTAAGTTVGSIAGAGTYYLGSKTLTVGGNNGSTAVSGIIADGGESGGTGGALVKTGTGTLTLSGANTYTGGTTVSAGKLEISGSGTLGAASGTVTVSGGTLDLGGTSHIQVGGVTLTSGVIEDGRLSSSGSFNLQAGTVSAALVGTGGLSKTGAGTVVLSGRNDYSGSTTLSAGTLQISGSGTLGAITNALTVSGGTLDLGGTGQAQNGGITLTGGTIQNGTLESSGGFHLQAGTVSAALAFGGYVSKTGAGTVVLSGQNSYSGGTTVSAGTLAISGSGKLGAASGATVVSGGTLDLGGTTQIQNGGVTLTSGAIQNGTLSSSGTFALQQGAVSAALAGTGGVIKTDAGTVVLTGANTYSGGTFVNAGKLQLGITGTSGSIAGTVSVANGSTFEVAYSDTSGITSISNSGGFVSFLNGTSAGNAVITNDSNGFVSFINTSSAGSAAITNSADLFFYGTSNAGDADITNNRSMGFYGSSSADSATITNDGSLNFYGTSTADGATIINNSGLTFWGDSKAGSADITNSGGTVSLFGSATADSATITTGAGGTTQFFDTSSGGSARFITNAGGTFDISGLTAAGTTAGSIEGAGNYSLGSKQLTVGSNDLSTTVSGVIADGSSGGTGGSLVKVGTGTLALTGANTYTGGTTISAGTLELGDGHGTGSILGDVVDDATLAFNRSDTYQFGGAISGSGDVEQNGGGTTILTADNSYTGATTVSGGTLLVNGSIAASSSVTVDAGATIGGSGTLSDTLVNGTLSAGNSPGTLTVDGNLTLGATSVSLFDLGAPGAVGGATNDLVHVTGDLILDGTLQTPGAVSGYYRLFDVDGTISGDYASVPTDAVVQTTIPNQVNLFIQHAGQIVQFWDGTDALGNGTVDGGDGTWDAAATNWTGAPGNAGINDQWHSSVGVFSGTGGTVTVNRPVAFAGLQFATGTYTIAGGDLTMSGDSEGNTAASFVTVDGGVTAQIASVLTGSGIGLDKFGGGTMTLTGANTYTGATTIAAGTLALSSSGSIADSSVVTVNGGIFDISGVTPTYTTIASLAGTSSGTVQMGGKVLVISKGSTEFAGVIDGSGSGPAFEVAGGTQTLTGVNTYTGSTGVQSGATLALKGDGSIAESDYLGIGGTFDISQTTAGSTVKGLYSATTTGVVALGSKTLTITKGSTFRGSVQDGGIGGGIGGSMVIASGAWQGLSGANTFTGTTTIDAGGILWLTGAGSLSASSGIVVNGTFDVSEQNTGADPSIKSFSGGGKIYLGDRDLRVTDASGTFSGAISDCGSSGANCLSGSTGGTLALEGGTLTLSGTNTYSGATTVGGFAGPPSAFLVVTNNDAVGTGSVRLNEGGVFQAGADGLEFDNDFKVSPSPGTIDTNGFTMAISGVIADATDPGTLHKAGAGTLILTNANTYGDGTVVEAGTLQIGNGGGTGSILGDVELGGVLVFNRSDTYTFAGIISDNGASIGQVVQDGPGTLVLTGTNTYSGGTVVKHGTLSLGSDAAAGTGAITTQGSVIDYAGGVTIANQIVIDSDTTELQVLTGTATQAGDISEANGPRPLEKTGAGTLVLAGDSTYTGQTTVSEGTLRAGTADTFSSVSAFVVSDSATLDLGSFDQAIASLSGAGVVALGAADLVVGQAGDSEFAGVISGSGSFIKAGAGDLLLSGINTYTGATMVSGGTLLVNGSIASSSGLTVNAGATIGGSGLLPSTIVNGTLSAGNSPGTLTVNGDLSLGAGSTSLFQFGTSGVAGGASNDLVNVTGNLALDGTLQAPGAVSGYYRLFNVGGVISGAFASAPTGASVVTAVPGQVNLLMQSGGQMVQFWDGADLVGNGTVDGGTGIWSAATTSWTGAPGSANFNEQWHNEVGVFAGTAGTVTVSGPVAFQGLQFATSGYTITGGDLTLSGDPQGNPVASFVNVDGGVAATIASALTGAGLGLDKLGAGTLILTGNNSYTGVTTVSAGTLRAGAAGAFVNDTHYAVNGGMLDLNGFDLTMSSFVGTGGTVALGGDLTVDQAGDTSFAGGITGAGGLTKDGTGKLLLSGTSTYTGQTFVKEGMLSVNGDISSSSLLTVGPGGAVGGSGLLPSVQVNGGTLAPGNSIGTVTIAGDLAFGAGSTYAVETSTTAADRTDVSGTADLSGGTVAVNYAPGTYVAKSYTILNAAGGLGGTEFKDLDAATLPGLITSLTYDGNNVYLKNEVKHTDPGCTTDCEPDFGNLNQNQKTVAGAIIDYFDRTGKLPAELATLDAEGLSQVSGETAAGAISAGIDSADQFMGELDGQRRAGSGDGNKVEAVFASRWQVWGSAYGGSEEIGGDPISGSHDTDTGTFGLIGGISRQWGDTKLGIALGGGSSNFSLSDGLGSGQANSFNAGIFARQGFGDGYVTGVFAYGFHDTQTNRLVQGDSLSAEFNAQSFSGRIESGYRFDTPVAALTPYAAFQAIAYHLPAYSETGANSGVFALDYDADTTTATRIELGLNLDRIIMLDDDSRLTLSGRAAWAINGGTERRVTPIFQSLQGATFTIDGAEPDRNSLLVGAVAEYKTRSGFSASLGFEGEFSGNVQSYSGKARLGFNW